MSTFDDLVRSAHEQGASDIFLTTNCAPVVRINGVSHKIKLSTLTESVLDRMLDDYLLEDERQNLDKGKFVVAARHEQYENLRISVYKTGDCMDIAIRILPVKPPSLDEIQYPDKTREFVIDSFKPGIMWVTGKCGNGLTTAVAAIAQYINSNYARSILIISDLEEFRFEGRQSFVEQISLNNYADKAYAFSQALCYARGFQVVIIDSPRSSQQVCEILELAHGAKVQIYCVVYEDNFLQWIDRLQEYVIYSFDEARIRLANSLLGEVNQCLVPTLNRKPRCAYRVMLGTPAIKNLIRDNMVAGMYSAIQAGAQYGMITRDQSLQHMIGDRVISESVARQYATNPDLFPPESGDSVNAG